MRAHGQAVVCAGVRACVSACVHADTACVYVGVLCVLKRGSLSLSSVDVDSVDFVECVWSASDSMDQWQKM